MRHIINSLLASMLLASCTTDIDLCIAPAPTSEPFYASIEGSTTRTYVGEEDKLLWSAGDRVTVFNGNTTPLEYQFTGSDGAESGALNPVSPASVDSGTALSANYAIYPHSASTTITDAGVINYTIPATQTYAENSFGLGANVMVAVSEDVDDRNFAFKNVGGYFEFSLYGDDVTVKSIEFSGNNDEKLAGNATITATHDGTPSIAFADDATTSLTLDCSEGVELGADAEHATKFWFVVPAITYEDGITITITDTEGKVMEKTTSNPITIERSTVQPLAAFEVETCMPTNQIWYTSSDGEVVTPRQTDDVFDVNIVSNIYENGKGVITFDGTVTSIGFNAFSYCSSLTSITIPNGVTSIVNEAFAYCSSLTSIIIPNSVTAIGENAFAHCSSLTSITIPNGVTSIEFQTFYNCPSLTSITIPEGVTSIGNLAFYNCASLKSITLPNSVTLLGISPFSACSSLESFEGKYASLDKRCLIVDGELKSFAPAGLTSYTIPSGITSIGMGAFASCRSLMSITIPSGVTSIGNGAFDYCTSLTSITIPNGVTSIGTSAFSSCSSLPSITLPDSITRIGNSAFRFCRSLTALYSKHTTPPSVGGNNTFDDCHSQLKIYVPTSSVNAYKSASGWSKYSYKIEGYDFSN